jgi:hypothetical protein
MTITATRLEHRIAAIAGRQHGVTTAAQLVHAGCSREAIKSLVRRGALHRRHQGVYAVGHSCLSREGRWSAAVLAGGEGAVLSHVSAAQHWGITRRRSDRIHVSTPRYRRRIADVTSHLLRPLQASGAVTVRDGIPVTTLERTIIDLATIVGIDELAFAMHEAAYLHADFDVSVIEAVIAAHPRFTGRGTLRLALERHLAGHTGARSRLELRVGSYLESVGVPPAIAGHLVDTPMGIIEVDLAWPDRRIYLEVDGFGHRRASTKRMDRERAQALRLAGWRRFVVVGDEFDADAADATEAIRAAFR